MIIKKVEIVDINEVVSVLKKGGLVIYPTETVYGIGADATNPEAIKKLNRYKQRPYGKPYSVAVINRKMAEKYVYLNNTAKKIYKKFLPGPVTVVSKGKGLLAKGVESETGTLGIRIPDYNLVLNVIKEFGKPITSTSANASYKRRPYKISDILDNISKKQKGLMDLIIDAGTLPKRDPSTVIDTTLDDPTILRQGEIKLKKTVKVLSTSEEHTQNISKELLQKYWDCLGKRPIIFALEGPMGAGKTQFAKGIGRTLNIKEEVVSPTFNLLLTYESQNPPNIKLEHFDAWRLQEPGELKTLGFYDLVKNKNVVIIIEWSEKVEDIIRQVSEDALIIWVKIAYGSKENQRLLSWGII